MARFAGHQQQDLGSCQGGQFICLEGREGDQERGKFKSQDRLFIQKDLALQTGAWIMFLSKTK